MVSDKPFTRLKRFLKKRGFTYKIRHRKIHEYTRFDLTILVFESPDLTHYKYIFLDTTTKWIINSVCGDRQDKFGYVLKNHLRKIEQKKL